MEGSLGDPRRDHPPWCVWELMDGGLEGSPLQPLPRLSSLAAWLDLLLQGIAHGRWSTNQA
eukprot:11630916-Alexandrium_andersonii.AAC.1